MTTAAHDDAFGDVKAIRSGGHVSVQPIEVTVVVAAAELLAGFESADIPLTVAVFVIVAPGPAFTFTTSVIGIDPPDPSAPSEQLIVPVPPGGGALQLPGLVRETNVVPAGTVSLKATPESGSGPLFVIPIV